MSNRWLRLRESRLRFNSAPRRSKSCRQRKYRVEIEKLKYLDRFVCATSDEASAGHIIRRAEDSCLRLKRARLGDVLKGLEGCTTIIIPEMNGPVVATREQDALGIDRHSIYDRILTREIEHERALRALPFLDVVSTS